MFVFVSSLSVVAVDFVNQIQAQPDQVGCYAPIYETTAKGGTVGPFSADPHSDHHCVKF